MVVEFILFFQVLTYTEEKVADPGQDPILDRETTADHRMTMADCRQTTINLHYPDLRKIQKISCLLTKLLR